MMLGASETAVGYSILGNKQGTEKGTTKHEEDIMERSAGTCTGNWGFHFGAFYHSIRTSVQFSSHQRFQDTQI
jgi:hypothetical protein